MRKHSTKNSEWKRGSWGEERTSPSESYKGSSSRPGTRVRDWLEKAFAATITHVDWAKPPGEKKNFAAKLEWKDPRKRSRKTKKHLARAENGDKRISGTAVELNRSSEPFHPEG